jgi:Holliday junction resolvase RusA-like endonuclease
MPVTQTDIDNLNKAIATGERQVTIGSQSVTYRSIDDLIKARNDMLQQMAQQDATVNAQPQKRRSYAYYAGRGYSE